MQTQKRYAGTKPGVKRSKEFSINMSHLGQVPLDTITIFDFGKELLVLHNGKFSPLKKVQSVLYVFPLMLGSNSESSVNLCCMPSPVTSWP